MVSVITNCSCPDNLLDSWSGLGEKYLIPIIGCLGLIGNLTAMGVLRSPQLKSTTFHQSLITLAICDILFLFFILADLAVDVQHVIYIYMFPFFWNPLKNIVMTWETFLTMSIATERFLAVCWPILYRRHKLRTSSFIHLLNFILPGLVLAILINIPKFLEVKLVDRKDTVDFQATQLRMDETYIFYYTHWTRLLATGVIPFLYLVIINTIIIIKIREGRIQSLKLRQNIKKPQDPSLVPVKPASSYLSLTLTGLVLVYLICNLPRLILNLVEYHLISEIYKLDSAAAPLLQRGSHC
jgi:hypothetical protein